MNILILDDEPSIRALLKAVFSRENHSVHEFTDGEPALDACRKIHYDLVVIDWMLHDISGLEVCRGIRSLPNGNDFFIVVYTGKDSLDDLERILDVGADDYIMKTADIKNLRVRLKIALQMAENKAARIQAEQKLAEARKQEIDIASRIQKNLLLGVGFGPHPDADCSVGSGVLFSR